MTTRPEGRQTELVSIRVPKQLLDDLDARRGVRSSAVRQAIELMLYGDAEKWAQRYKAEHKRRLLLEQRLERIRLAANE